MSLFGANMTAFALLGASGAAYYEGIGGFALMASISALIIPSVFYVGTRPWWWGPSLASSSVRPVAPLEELPGLRRVCRAAGIRPEPSGNTVWKKLTGPLQERSGSIKINLSYSTGALP